MFEISIRGLIAEIEKGKIVLPAMQRPFVWQEERIFRLIDSLLREFPLGAVLMWKTSTVQRFRRFQKDVDPRVDQVFSYESDASGDRYLVLDGQQRLTSFLISLRGTYNGRRLFLNALSGSSEDKDPGDTYFDSRFCTDAEAKGFNDATTGERVFYAPFRTLTDIEPANAPRIAFQKAQELKLSDKQSDRLMQTYLQCASAVRSDKALQVLHPINEDVTAQQTPIKEILEIFVRVNSGGLILNKSDLLISLLDMEWQDIQPKLQEIVRDINLRRPFSFTRDDILKSLLLAVGSDTRFDRLVSDQEHVEQLAQQMPAHLPTIHMAWRALTTLLMDTCRITSERFFRGGHNSLLPFVMWLFTNPTPTPSQKKALCAAIYLAIMSGVFAGAEARMGTFTRQEAMQPGDFPIAKLAQRARSHYGLSSFEDLLHRHLDLALNIAHGGITLDGNPEDLQRDHIFPKATLLRQGKTENEANHYANFHFLRAKDNLNKSDTPPHLWFQNPGRGVPAYADNDLEERLLCWALLEPGAFETMVQERSQRIKKRAEERFGMTVTEFDALFF